MEIWKPINMTDVVKNEVFGQLPTWTPKLGVEFNRFVARLPDPQQMRLTDETLRILSACIDPTQAVNAPRRNAGLVLGYVQSGKTSSFTAATALAHDHGFKLVIVVGGVSRILLNQTFSRLQSDLDLSHSDVVNRWTKVLNPKLGPDPAVQQIQNLLTTHAGAVRAGRPTVGPTPIIVVMKETSHLRNLNAFLSGIAGPQKDQLLGLSALVIDDECHMATPNVAKRDEKSRIYALMGEMRSYLPHHSLLQYTATPQANLLCELEDEFRPDFVRLLGHGPDYTGGSKFFLEPPKGRVIKSIPKDEQALAKAAEEQDESVPSLQAALASYLLIAANDYQRKLDDNSHAFERFSMLVHSDASIGIHVKFQSWLTGLKNSWLKLLKESPDFPDLLQLRNSLFTPAYTDLSETFQGSLLPLDSIFGEPMAAVLNGLQIWLVDGSKNGTRQPDFSLSNYNILNGGEMLGVGFTIPRLHVTHMLRSAGQGQMDTIQQRGRFFGYCGSWFGEIRVWLEDDVRRAFEGYVEEEEWLRRDLEEFDKGNKQLKGWKVRLRLNRDARPTRRNAIRREIQRFKTDGGWTRQSYWITNDATKSANSKIIEDFKSSSGDFASPGSKPLGLNLIDQSLRGKEERTEHHIAAVEIDSVRKLLALYATDVRDRDDFDVVLETLDEILDKPDLYLNSHGRSVDVVFMAHGAKHLRRRFVNPESSYVDLFQGEGDNYVGDRKVHTDKITLQIHTLNHGPSDEEIEEQSVVYLALWLPNKPREWAENWILEL